MKRIVSIIITIVLSASMLNSYVIETEAANDICEEDYIIINDNVKIPMYQDYYNSDTGEYFIWNTSIDNRGSVAKSFTYKIRYSVTSSQFSISSSDLYVSSSAYIEDPDGSWFSSGYIGHLYQIEVKKGLSYRSLQFALGMTETGDMTGLPTGSGYTVTITNNDYLPGGYYLVGSGTIENN